MCKVSAATGEQIEGEVTAIGDNLDDQCALANKRRFLLDWEDGQQEFVTHLTLDKLVTKMSDKRTGIRKNVPEEVFQALKAAEIRSS